MILEIIIGNNSYLLSGFWALKIYSLYKHDSYNVICLNWKIYVIE